MILKMLPQFVAVLVVLVAVAKGDGGTCDGSLVQALQKCANAIKGGESLSVQQEKCAPDGCNYDCPSANKLNDLTEQVKNLSAAFETIKTTVTSNSASIDNIKGGYTVCGTSGWTRVAYLDMSDPSQDCPTEFRLHSGNGVRGCGRLVSSNPSCDSKTFSSNSITYSEVCGRVLGYQYATADAIGSNNDGHNDIDSYYLDGISITRGSPPRQHIWTYMAGVSEVRSDQYSCPCNEGSTVAVQSFIGDDYYCESGNPVSGIGGILYSDDTLWDGKDCVNNEVPCCKHADLPWFYKVFDTATDDDVEIRVCGDENTNNEDSPILLYEIFVK